jgi:hypothetical protein
MAESHPDWPILTQSWNGRFALIGRRSKQSRIGWKAGERTSNQQASPSRLLFGRALFCALLASAPSEVSDSRCFAFGRWKA